MWKLTSWGFRKCGSFRDLEVLNRSYGCSKSEDFEIFGPLPKIRGVTKKQHSVNNEFFVPKRISAQDNPIGYSFYSFRASNPKISRVLFSRDGSFFFKFDSTSTAYSSGLKPQNLKNYHIFGILRTSAFRWAIGKAAGVNIVRTAGRYVAQGGRTQKLAKKWFFCFFRFSSKILWRKFLPG